MADMRVLVIDVLECPTDQPAAVAALHGHAYLHLAMVKFGEILEMDLSVYNNQSDESERFGHERGVNRRFCTY